MASMRIDYSLRCTSAGGGRTTLLRSIGSRFWGSNSPNNEVNKPTNAGERPEWEEAFVKVNGKLSLGFVKLHNHLDTCYTYPE